MNYRCDKATEPLEVEMRPAQHEGPVAVHVVVTDDLLTVELSDSRRISAPISWYPRMAQGSANERSDWRSIGRGSSIHWPDLDEDKSELA